MHEPITVQLNRKEVLAALEVAIHGHLNEIGERFQLVKTGSLTFWDGPINDALADAAVRKWLNGRTDVKARAALRDYGNLIINDTDSPSGIICLVSCLPPQFRIHGFVRVGEAREMEDCMRQTEGGRRWWISKDKLRDPRELGNG